MVVKRLIKRIQNAPERWNKRLKKGKLLIDKTSDNINRTIKENDPWSKSNQKIKKLQKQLKTASHDEKGSIKAKIQFHKRDRVGDKIADVQKANKKKVKEHVAKKNKDWELMKKNKMSKEDFMRKYPNSGTTRRHTAKMNVVQKRKFLKSLKERKPLGTRFANMLDNK